MTIKNEKYLQVKRTAERIANLSAASALLSWDQETYMKKGSAARRGNQLATLGGIIHSLKTKELYPLVKETAEFTFNEEIKQRNIQRLKENLEKSTKLPQEFVEYFSRLQSEAFCAWEKAKTEDDFSLFQPYLEKIVEAVRKKAEYFGYKNHPYDALLDYFEPKLTTTRVEQLFSGLKPKLRKLLDKIEQAKQVDDEFVFNYYSHEKQFLFSQHLMKGLGFDTERGRLDESMHPFSTGLAPEDVRITTNVYETDLIMAITSTIHEVGHGLYEQGLNPNEYGMPAGEAASYAIHESQSRLWENNIGRSKAFWEFYFPILQSYFPDELENITTEQFFKAINKVQPNLIRIASDELTYHFHIILRFEIEKALVEGSIQVKDLPEIWNAKIKEYLGLDVPNNAKGVLQDVHWSHGYLGYFPSYSIGSFYSAQFLHYAEQELGSIDELVRKGEFKTLLHWLQNNIFVHGALYYPEELCVKVCGEPLNTDYFLKYMDKKMSQVYNTVLTEF